MEEYRSLSPASITSSHEEFALTPSPSTRWFAHRSLCHPIRSTPPIVRHNFRSIEALLSPITLESPLTVKTECISYDDDTGYQSHLLCASSESEELEQQRTYEPSTPESKKPMKTKKNRTAFTDAQRCSLERFYITNRYPDPTELEDLSRMLTLEEKVIRIWFQNKRSREKTRPNPMLVPTVWQHGDLPIDFSY